MNSTDDNSVILLMTRAWSLVGFSMILLYGLYRMVPVSLSALQYTIEWQHWLVLATGLPFMIYTEGIRGFQQQFSPRFVQRTLSLSNRSPLSWQLLAPFYAMCFFAAPRRRVVSSWILTIMIVALVIMFHQISQPMRGILDACVVVGLTWGLVVTWIEYYRQLGEKEKTKQ